MERIDFTKQKIPFTQVANGVLYDRELSLGAKTIYAFMYSKPDGWQFSAYRIGEELNVSEPTVLKHLRELKEKGYLLSKKEPTGRMLYKVIFPPADPNQTSLSEAPDPNQKKARLKKSQTEKSLVISNKENKVIKRISNKDTYGEFQNVKLTIDEKEKLKARYGVVASKKLVEELSTYIASNNKRYNSHYATLLAWARRKGVEEIKAPLPVNTTTDLTDEQVEANKKRLAQMRTELAGQLKMR